jgi:hypothetical protein
MYVWVQKIVRCSKGGLLPPFEHLQPLSSKLPTHALPGPIPRPLAPRCNALYPGAKGFCFTTNQETKKWLKDYISCFWLLDTLSKDRLYEVAR